MRVAILVPFALAASLAPAFAGPEMPMYQFPQANQIPMLPDPSTKPGAGTQTERPCVPEENPPGAPAQNSPDATTPVAVAAVSTGEQKYHLVGGKCVAGR
jgi:hypothetical protein